jgi:hypothetical protein
LKYSRNREKEPETVQIRFFSPLLYQLSYPANLNEKNNNNPNGPTSASAEFADCRTIKGMAAKFYSANNFRWILSGISKTIPAWPEFIIAFPDLWPWPPCWSMG